MLEFLHRAGIAGDNTCEISSRRIVDSLFQGAQKLEPNGWSCIPGGLTVVMPLHNKGPHVDRALKSVLNQSAGFDSLIVVDDASTDDGAARVRACDDPRIVLLRRDVPGPGGYAARNLAIEAARTEWIAFLDADDSWETGFTTSLVRLIERFGSEIGCAFTSYATMDPDGERRLQPCGRDLADGGLRKIDLPTFLDLWLHYQNSPIWTGAVAVRRSVLHEVGLFPAARCRRGGDKDLWLRILMSTRAGFDPSPQAIYFRDASNMVTQNVRIDCAHCIVPTIAAGITDLPGEVATRLKRLSNLETYSYALMSARTNTINSSIYERYYDAAFDTRYYMTRLLHSAPASMRPTIARVIQRLRARASKYRPAPRRMARS